MSRHGNRPQLTAAAVKAPGPVNPVSAPAAEPPAAGAVQTVEPAAEPPAAEAPSPAVVEPVEPAAEPAANEIAAPVEHAATVDEVEVAHVVAAGRTLEGPDDILPAGSPFATDDADELAALIAAGFVIVAGAADGATGGPRIATAGPQVKRA